MEETFEDLVKAVISLKNLGISDDKIYEFLEEHADWAPDSLHEAFNMIEEGNEDGKETNMDLF